MPGDRCLRCGHDAHHADVLCTGTFCTDGLVECCICANCRCDACAMGPRGIAPSADPAPDSEGEFHA